MIKATRFFLPQKWMTGMNSPSVQSYQNLYHFIPQNILSDVLKRASTLRWLGNDKFNGRKQDVVAFAFQNGSVVNLFFDSKTHLLTKYTRFTTRNTLGDTVSEVVFKDYKDSQGTKIPTSRISFQGGILVSDLKYRELVFNPKVSENFYDLPEGLTRLDLVEPQTKIKQIDENIYLLSNLSGGFNMLAVEFKDFVLTVEAPEGNSVNGISARALKMIKEKFPDKPVKYSVLTHHHGDHSAGIRAFVSEGATVITTQGNKDYVKSLTDIKFVFSPDLLTLKPNNLRMEFVTEGKKIISDDQNTVEIYQIGPIYHSEEMLLVYLPRQKLLFQSDLFNPIKPEISSTLDDPWHGIHRSDTLSLAEAIEKLNLDVEKIAGSHGRISTIEEFNEDVRKIKQSKDKF